MTLSLFASSVPRSAIADIALPDQAPLVTTEALVRLQKLSLVKQQQERYEMLPLTREYVQAELATHADLELTLRQRWVTWFLQFLQEFGGSDWKDWQSNQTGMDQEWKNLQGVMEWCIAHAWYEQVCQLWKNLKGYTYARGYWDERLEWATWLQEQAESRKDWQTLIEAMNDCSWILLRRQQLDAAAVLLERAWNLKRGQTPATKLDLASNLAVLCTRQRRFEEAKKWFRQQKQLIPKVYPDGIEQQKRQVQLLYYQGQMAYTSREYSTAKTLYTQALEQAQRVGWSLAIVSIQNWLADVEIDLGNLDAARHLLERSLPIAEQIQDKESIAFHQLSRAKLEKACGHLSQARRLAQEAATRFEQLKMIDGAQEARSLFQS